jgi:4-alpha-glucanotransferase
MSIYFDRSAGLLLHITSLPAITAPHGNGEFGSDGMWAAGDLFSGDLGPSAYEFVRFLSKAKQKWWQVLPCTPTGYGFSPYQSPSSFAGNPLLVSPALLVRDGLLRLEEWHDASKHLPPNGTWDRCHLEISASKRIELLRIAFRRFQNQRSEIHSQWEVFRHRHHTWLDDHCLFTACKNYHQDKAWNAWDSALAQREPHAMVEWGDKLRVAIEFESFIQFLFDRQWLDLRNYARTQGVFLIGDIPIFVAMDSADVWAQQDLFELDKQGNPNVVAGVPPDYFSATGQRWGNPLYRWDVHKQTGYDWWMRRFRRMLEQCDLLRIDHFRGFEAYWEIPAHLPDARIGEWKVGPREEFFETLSRGLGGGELPVIAEDLGFITPEVHALRDRFHFPGMRIVQFGFGAGDSSSHDLPHNFPTHCIAYTGTHDNDTVVGWFNSKVGEGSTRTQWEIDREKHFALRYLCCNAEDIHLGMMRSIWSSVATMTLAPVQDLLGLDSTARMNTPGTSVGNWVWRCPPNVLDTITAESLAEMTWLYGRCSKEPTTTSKA